MCGALHICRGAYSGRVGSDVLLTGFVVCTTLFIQVWGKLVAPFIAHWKKLNVQPPRISSESMGKTSALVRSFDFILLLQKSSTPALNIVYRTGDVAQDPVDGFVKQQVELAEKLVTLVGGAFASIDKVARGAELLSPGVQVSALASR